MRVAWFILGASAMFSALVRLGCGLQIGIWKSNMVEERGEAFDCFIFPFPQFFAS